MRSLIVALLVTGCGASTTVDFKPRVTPVPPAIVERAVLADRDDAELLASVGGEILGSLEIEGSSSAEPEDVRARAIVEGARVGGTHVLIADERTAEERERITGDGKVRWGGDGERLHSERTEGHTVAHETSRGMFVVIRVPAERWSELPAALRPTPRPAPARP